VILQIDPRWTHPSMHPYGCHVLTECFIINRVGNVPMGIDIIETMIKVLGERKAPNGNPVVDGNLVVNDPDQVVTYFGLQYSRSCRMEGPTYVCLPTEQELLQWHRPGITFYHWTAGDGRGNCTFDPEGYSLSVRYGGIVAKKVFTIHV
jgi:hypothetical protein